MTPNEVYLRKAEEIGRILSEPEVDLWKLREFALSEGGLVNDSIRRRAWPKLLGLDGDSTSVSPPPSPPQRFSNARNPQSPQGPPPTVQERRPSTPPLAPFYDPFETDPSLSSNSISPMKEFNPRSTNSIRLPPVMALSVDSPQVEMDVSRCIWHLLTGSERAQRIGMDYRPQTSVTHVIRTKQRRLANLINHVLVRSSEVPQPEALRYYQGYHDVACVLLSVLDRRRNTFVSAGHGASIENMANNMGLERASSVLLRLSRSHFHIFMKSSFVQLKTVLDLSIFPLIAFFDADVHAHLYTGDMQPTFCLSWVITWFAHEIRDTNLVKRIFDVFLVSHPLLPLYVSVAMVLHPHNRREILQTECDFCQLHQVVANLPKHCSTVGWEPQPAMGYVSNYESTTDEPLSTFRNDTNEIVVDSVGSSYNGEALFELENTTFSIGCSSIEPDTKVPFQDLIDMAMIYMNKIPPKDLVRIASRYHGSERVQDMMRQTPCVHVFEAPPAYTVQSTAKADWLIREEVCEQQSPSRNLRTPTKNQTALPNTGNRTFSLDDGNVRSQLYMNSNCLAAVALGYGRGDLTQQKRRKRQRQHIKLVATCAFTVVGVGVATHFGNFQLPLLHKYDPPSPEIETHFADVKENVDQMNTYRNCEEKSVYQSESFVKPQQAKTAPLAEAEALRGESTRHEADSKFAFRPNKYAANQAARLVEETRRLSDELTLQIIFSMKSFKEETRRLSEEIRVEASRFGREARLAILSENRHIEVVRQAKDEVVITEVKLEEKKEVKRIAKARHGEQGMKALTIEETLFADKAHESECKQPLDQKPLNYEVMERVNLLEERYVIEEAQLGFQQKIGNIQRLSDRERFNAEVADNTPLMEKVETTVKTERTDQNWAGEAKRQQGQVAFATRKRITRIQALATEDTSLKAEEKPVESTRLRDTELLSNKTNRKSRVENEAMTDEDTSVAHKETSNQEKVAIGKLVESDRVAKGEDGFQSEAEIMGGQTRLFEKQTILADASTKNEQSISEKSTVCPLELTGRESQWQNDDITVNFPKGEAALQSSNSRNERLATKKHEAEGQLWKFVEAMRLEIGFVYEKFQQKQWKDVYIAEKNLPVQRIEKIGAQLEIILRKVIVKHEIPAIDTRSYSQKGCINRLTKVFMQFGQHEGAHLSRKLQTLVNASAKGVAALKSLVWSNQMAKALRIGLVLGLDVMILVAAIAL